MKLVYNDISKIPNLLYVGYIWGSDQQKPKVLINEAFQYPSDSSLYIVEALLFSKEDNISITIRHTGQQQISQYNLNELPQGSKRYQVNYLPHRLSDKIKKVKFQQIWIPEEDAYSQNWEVLKMKALIFTGFKI